VLIASPLSSLSSLVMELELLGCLPSLTGIFNFALNVVVLHPKIKWRPHEIAIVFFRLVYPQTSLAEINSVTRVLELIFVRDGFFTLGSMSRLDINEIISLFLIG
jgi:hypothetical protein